MDQCGLNAVVSFAVVYDIIWCTSGNWQASTKPEYHVVKILHSVFHNIDLLIQAKKHRLHLEHCVITRCSLLTLDGVSGEGSSSGAVSG